MRKMLIGFMFLVGCSNLNPMKPSPVIGGNTSTEPPSTIVVPGTSDLWLAGMQNGSRASGFTAEAVGVDVAPDQSPVYIMLKINADYEFNTLGPSCVANGPELPCFKGDGGDWLGAPMITHFAGSQNGILNLSAPVNSLIGIWENTNQPFFMGKNGQFHVVHHGNADPAGAVLYLGTMDGFEWNNNSGFFLVKFEEIMVGPKK